MPEGGTREMDIAVAGGSIAGLCAGTALLIAGFDVQVFERSPGRLTSRGAGIVVQPDLLGLLSSVDASPLAMTGCTVRRTLHGTSGIVQEMRMPQRFTSWEAIYTALRSVFPEERYHSGAPLHVVEAKADGIVAEIGGDRIRSRLLIAADGFRSGFRRHYAPETTSRYAGYIAWRGVVDETATPAELVNFFDNAFTFCQVADGGHALCYLIPGDGLDTAKGTRRLNWVWYIPVPEGPALEDILTDRNGERRDAAVPEGVVNDESLAGLLQRADALDGRFAELVRLTPSPFIQSIMDVAPPALVFGPVCLIGDAAFVVRPHTAAAAAKAAADASALAQALRGSAPDLDEGLRKWERLRLQAGRELLDYGVRLGERS